MTGLQVRSSRNPQFRKATVNLFEKIKPDVSEKHFRVNAGVLVGINILYGKIRTSQTQATSSTIFI